LIGPPAVPAPRKITLSDHELLLALEQGETTGSIAQRCQCTAEAVRDRLRRLRENLPAPAARRAEETVAHTLDAMAALEDNFAVLGALKRACLKQLAADEEGELDIGPHDYDLEVTVVTRGGVPLKKPVRALLEGADVAGIEAKMADPRTLLVQVVGQIRQHIELAVKLTERIYDVQQVHAFQEEVLRVIHEADPPTAARIRGALHERRSLRLALRPPGGSG
jgi:hypothetical protein